MINSHYAWQLQPVADEKVRHDLSSQLHVSPTMAQLLANRGLKEADAAQAFLQPDLQTVHDSHQLHDMDKAVERIEQAIAANEKITVYGDYDADGITSTAVMYEALNEIGANVDYYIPDRFKDGYGPNADAYQRIITAGTKLIITVDNGVSGKDVIDNAMVQGVDVVVTDHHELPRELPNAVAIVHPRYPGSNYPFPDLSGVGVAFKVVWALQDEFPEEMLDLLAIGEIADVVSVTDENRALIGAGIQLLRQGMRPGIHALLQVAGVNEAQLTSTDIGFTIAPRLNALGRIADANAGVELLTTVDEQTGSRLAQQVEAANQKRRELVDQIMGEASAQAAHALDQPVLLLVGHNWHQGVLGIVASRIMDQTGKPTIVASANDGSEVAKASGRSIAGFNLFDALDPHRDLLTTFGGHPAACGLSFELSKTDELRAALLAEAQKQQFDSHKQIPLVVDAQLRAGDVNGQLYQEIQKLGPFGPGNEEPIFEFNDVQPSDVRTMGKNNDHLKFSLNGQVTVVAFNQGKLAPILEDQGGQVDLVAKLSVNEWQGKRTVQLLLTDIRVRGTVILDQRTSHLTANHFGQAGFYVVEDTRLRENIAPHVGDGKALSIDQAATTDFAGKAVTVVDCPKSLAAFTKIFEKDSASPALVRLLLFENNSVYLAGLPTRDDFAALYRFLARQANIQWPGQRTAVSRYLRINEVRLNLMINVFSEVGFVTISNGVLNLAKNTQKADLKQTDHYQAQLARYQAEQMLLYSNAGALAKWVLQCLKED